MKSKIANKAVRISLKLLIVILHVSCTPQIGIQKPLVTHAVEYKNGVSYLWSLDNIYTVQDDFQPAMSASSNIVCFLGDTTFPPRHNVSCFDTVGKTKWQKKSGTTNGILVSDGVYVTYGGRPGVEKYDIEGSLLWDYSFKGMGVVYIYLQEDNLHLFLLPERSVILSTNSGMIIEETQGESIIFQTPTEQLVKESMLVSRSVDTHQINWEFFIGNSVRLAPLITDDVIFLRTGRTVGVIQAIDRKTGNLLWQLDDDVISNVILLPELNSICALTRDGRIITIQIQSGASEILAIFSSVPFILNGEDVVGGYELAYDQKANILYVLLGDSRQLFAFQLDE